ncbi:MAG: acetyl-CoA hydrolase/transferase C-terminal domain-containing protein [Myxococcota bacterium]
MDWRDRCGDKLVSPEAAVKQISSGDVVGVAPYTCTPHTLCSALMAYAKAGGIQNVRIDQPAALFPWSEADGAFDLHDNYATPQNRAACHAGEMEYLPIGLWKSYSVPPGFTEHPDVFLVPVSPPNDKGYCSFGPGVWLSGTLTRNSKLVIAEVQPDFIRTYGENYIHVDQIDLFVEGDVPTGDLPADPHSEEEVAAVEVICALVAAELVNDRDTLQMGVGTVSASLGLYLGAKNDLGIQTELITGGIVDLVKQGVVTGRYKTLHPYKVVGSGIVALSREELEAIHENPVFELYDFGYTDDLRRLIQQDNFVAVNNALVVDLTGQVSAESIDHRMYTGVGGQTVFMIAGAYSPGGKSVSVTPSSSVLSSTGERVSRIVPVLAPGGVVTVPRTYVDYVVTEYGIATLRGKTIKERARELAAVSHPDFRPELEQQASKLYGA